MIYVNKLVKNKSTPFLFSYRRCPYAMRARMALIDSKINFNAFEITLKNKPSEMLDISPKGTVPILIFGEEVIDESIDIMMWAYKKGISLQYSNFEKKLINIGLDLIQKNDNEFKLCLDQYKYSINYPSKTKEELQNSCLFFLEVLEDRLDEHFYLLSDKVSFADIAIMPFIRQFANVDMKYFSSLRFSKVQRWLLALINSELFIKAMIKP
ncbi:glutathione S-transferase [Methylophilaceae bacterium]|nr:glutathione S-transferase [Methylophilaceae bacterium]